jgi:hypothetical protein
LGGEGRTSERDVTARLGSGMEIPEPDLESNVVKYGQVSPAVRAFCNLTNHG